MVRGALRLLILTCLLKVGLCAPLGTHVYVNILMNWIEAREYCRAHYTDLSSIHSSEEDKELLQITEGQLPLDAWIGLYKDATNTWKWSGGRAATFFSWSTMDYKGEAIRCVVHSRIGWYGTNCGTEQFRFYCFQSNLLLVTEEKSWEEAMEHCRQHGKDLVSLVSESVLTHALQISRKAQTNYVWTGMRYLGVSWLWVNGDNMVYQAWGPGETPQCPSTSHRCGALSLWGQNLESRDCDNKYNFVCY